MKQANASPVTGQKELASPQPKSPLRRIALKVCVIILALALVFAGTLFRVYGVDTHHASRGSIWWPERGRNLIPPTATNITLRRDLLDHYGVYTLSEKDLNAFLDKRFARPGDVLDSFSERSPANPENIGNAIGPLGWVVTKDTVEYTYYASNGGAHNYYHDTKTGRTYQSSAYW
ncbi:hypothetical protein N9124_01735 [bacterium]|nr:hypothetical protein [bacterium]MDA7537589.1 hypothetical protein [Akkermansiaceae bacterium]MDA7611553.1 hypothetical protein [bacterium]MDA7649118.1 hypothetical protein [Akkermansiaceae bacterium]MDA8876094.1 hypothetical protein [Akkermansiaceae bacterium]